MNSTESLHLTTGSQDSMRLAAVYIQSSERNGTLSYGKGLCAVQTDSSHKALSETSQKKTYIDAVLCLQRHEAITKKQFADNDKLNPKNRFDDFHAVHNSQTPDIHFVGHFALWHRYMLAKYERTLRNVCGYKGAQP